MHVSLRDDCSYVKSGEVGKLSLVFRHAKCSFFKCVADLPSGCAIVRLGLTNRTGESVMIWSSAGQRLGHNDVDDADCPSRGIGMSGHIGSYLVTAGRLRSESQSCHTGLDLTTSVGTWPRNLGHVDLRQRTNHCWWHANRSHPLA